MGSNCFGQFVNPWRMTSTRAVLEPGPISRVWHSGLIAGPSWARMESIRATATEYVNAGRAGGGSGTRGTRPSRIHPAASTTTRRMRLFPRSFTTSPRPLPAVLLPDGPDLIEVVQVVPGQKLQHPAHRFLPPLGVHPVALPVRARHLRYGLEISLAHRPNPVEKPLRMGAPVAQLLGPECLIVSHDGIAGLSQRKADPPPVDVFGIL